jgi:ATP-dependent RNA helicase DDX31/DBP7
VKKSKQPTEPSVILDEVLKNERKFEIPKQLPTVDFMDEPKKNKNKKNERSVVDFTNVPAKRTEKPQKKPKKPKFSKVSNPYPNDPLSKQTQQAEVKVKPVKEKKQQAEEETEELQEPEPKKIEKKQQPEPKKPKKSHQDSGTGSDNKNVFTSDLVDSLKIHPHSVKNMKDVLNFHKLTHVQQKSIPAGLEGKDLLIRSPTGSGKTLSYALPIVERLASIEPKLKRTDGIHALVIVPTRELAVQTYELFVKLVKPFQWIVPGILSGGEKRKNEKTRIGKGITILVSTPGRICDHLMHTESMKLNKIQVFALDEADRLLELSYENDVAKVVDTIAEQNKDSRNIQKILLSATLTSKVKKLAGLTLNNPVYVDNDSIDNDSLDTMKNSLLDVETDDNIIIPTGIDQKYFMVPPKLRFIVLCSLIVTKMKRGAKKILIFLPTQNVVDYSYDILVEFLTQSFTKKERSAKSYLNDDNDDIDAEESEEEDEGNIWLPNVTFFK